MQRTGDYQQINRHKNIFARFPLNVFNTCRHCCHVIQPRNLPCQRQETCYIQKHFQGPLNTTGELKILFSTQKK